MQTKQFRLLLVEWWLRLKEIYVVEYSKKSRGFKSMIQKYQIWNWKILKVGGSDLRNQSCSSKKSQYCIENSPLLKQIVQVYARAIIKRLGWLHLIHLYDLCPFKIGWPVLTQIHLTHVNKCKIYST